MYSIKFTGQGVLKYISSWGFYF